MDQQKETQPIQRRSRGVQRIVSILDAAETVFTEMGYDEATTNHIAARAKISPGSLYQFFSNKEEIVQALAARYTEELQEIYNSVFSIEATALPLPQWLDQIFDRLVAFHLAHPAFLLLFSRSTAIAQYASSTHALQKEVQTRFEAGFQRRAPSLDATQRILCATMSVQLFKTILPLLLQAEEAERRLLMRELKTMLCSYLENRLK
ncbi:TetR/AcrR family transcriptional regulator [Ktedonospora formicarum]|uniref:TetR family transcriptional regulator n=1 Tax=Ktedonospora formicarum TaxID=2778364 RepID=A0A8J3HQP2_9CHLR|nr:TetR/AcrR family transcriptional regulator [Ktedonospora formicarum]GHO42047.1 TetR family transcriptional regulator [Ktedonospora formicarum]